MERRLKHWGWGYEDQRPSRRELEEAAAGVRAMLGFGDEPEEPAELSDVTLGVPRLRPPEGPEGLWSEGHYERVAHTLGSAYRDVVRGFRGVFDSAPDLVAFPRDGEEVERVLDFAESAGAAVVPYGGGTSVVGGVEARLEDLERPVVSLDTTRMDRVLEVDPVSLAARIQAGIKGPALEEALGAHGLTLRHYPQSFEYSTLGGWIVTRAGGHFATGETHVDDLVESVTAVTPRGEWASRRLPGSGAGPSPDRMLIGSEGILGVVTEAWMRVRPRPTEKASVTVEFDGFAEAALGAVRELAQSRLTPSNCRLIDPLEARTTGAGDGSATLLLIGFESAHAPVDGRMAEALRIAEEYGGRPAGDDRPARVREAEDGGRGSGRASAESWKGAFLLAPYLRDTFVACGILSETFETAITWDRFEAFHSAVMDAARSAVAEVCGEDPSAEGGPRISCRLTHVYPDGAAPYYTVLAPARRGGEVEQWDEVKAAVSEAIASAGGTITHHHAVGRDHRPWYDRQRPEPFAAALGAAKRELDPAGTLNPGVLVDP